jgi:dienelactone hydrolase
MFYTVEEYFKNRFDGVYRPYAFRAKTRTEYELWKKGFRQLLSRLLGFDKMLRCEPNPQLIGSETMDGYAREKFVINTEPGVQMPFYILKPEKTNGKLPLMLAPHGHAGNGKSAVCGIDKGNERLKEAIREYNYNYGVRFVKEGFIVFCPDARGFGERAEKYEQDGDRLLNSSCAYLNAMAYPLGMNVTGMWTWDLMRLLDYALTRDDVDKDKVNCAGLSGGGLQTLWLAAMDERVKNAIISGYFYGYKQALLEMHNCSCNYIPGLWENADMGDVTALIANRGVFIETGDADPLNGAGGLDNVYPQAEIVRRAAELPGNGGNIVHHVFSGAHRWCGEKSVMWIKNQNEQEAD